MKKPIKLPRFKSEEEEWAFWDTIDVGDYLEPSDFRHVVFPNLKPSSSKVTLRMSNWLLSRVKERANALDVPYQSLIKLLVERGLKHL